GRIDSTTDVDYYSVTSPSTTSNLVFSIATSTFGQAPYIARVDANGNFIETESIATQGNRRVFQVTNAPANTTYRFVVVNSASTVTSPINYDVTADFHDAIVLNDSTVAGAASSTNTYSRQLQLNRPQLISFRLGFTDPLGVSSSSSLRLRIINSDNIVVGDWTANAFNPTAGSIFLPAGRYIVRVTTTNASNIAFDLSVSTLTDPIGVDPIDPTSPPPPPTSPPTSPPPTSPPTSPPPAPPLPVDFNWMN
ncbi:MAG: hypothetical protein ACRCZF_27310, partial [Gemmataceae bacterium]